MEYISPKAVTSVVVGLKEARQLWNWLLARQGLSEELKFTTALEVADSSLGLHAARLQSPFATVLARASSPAVALNLFTASTRNSLITVRCMRKTLHVLPLRLASAAHAATLHFRERDALRTIVNAGAKLHDVEHIIHEVVCLLSQTGPLFHRHIEDTLLHGRRTAPLIRLAIKLAWESGVLAYLNHTTSWNREDRRFGLTTNVYPDLDFRMDRNAANVELISAYFDRYGPASIRDAMWWSGLSRSAILSALQSCGREVIAILTPWADTQLYMFCDRFEEFSREASDLHLKRLATLNFLAHEDVALKAYFETRDRYLAGIPIRAAFNQIGEAVPTILLGGHVVGTWAWNRKTRRIEYATIAARLPRAVRIRIPERLDALSEIFRVGCTDDEP